MPMPIRVRWCRWCLKFGVPMVPEIWGADGAQRCRCRVGVPMVCEGWVAKGKVRWRLRVGVPMVCEGWGADGAQG